MLSREILKSVVPSQPTQRRGRGQSGRRGQSGPRKLTSRCHSCGVLGLVDHMLTMSSGDICRSCIMEGRVHSGFRVCPSCNSVYELSHDSFLPYSRCKSGYMDRCRTCFTRYSNVHKRFYCCQCTRVRRRKFFSLYMQRSKGVNDDNRRCSTCERGQQRQIRHSKYGSPPRVPSGHDHKWTCRCCESDLPERRFGLVKLSRFDYKTVDVWCRDCRAAYSRLYRMRKRLGENKTRVIRQVSYLGEQDEEYLVAAWGRGEKPEVPADYVPKTSVYDPQETRQEHRRFMSGLRLAIGGDIDYNALYGDWSKENETANPSKPKQGKRKGKGSQSKKRDKVRIRKRGIRRRVT